MPRALSTEWQLATLKIAKIRLKTDRKQSSSPIGYPVSQFSVIRRILSSGSSLVSGYPDWSGVARIKRIRLARRKALFFLPLFFQGRKTFKGFTSLPSLAAIFFLQLAGRVRFRAAYSPAENFQTIRTLTAIATLSCSGQINWIPTFYGSLSLHRGNNDVLHPRSRLNISEVTRRFSDDIFFFFFFLWLRSNQFDAVLLSSNLWRIRLVNRF